MAICQSSKKTNRIRQSCQTGKLPSDSALIFSQTIITVTVPVNVCRALQPGLHGYSDLTKPPNIISPKTWTIDFLRDKFRETYHLSGDNNNSEGRVYKPDVPPI